MLADFAEQHDFGYVILRYFNAAGADVEGQLAERHDPETHLIPLALEAAYGGAPLNVFGTDYDTPDGTCIRDFIHVSDLAAGHLAALAHLQDSRGQRIALSVNLGTGNGLSIREISTAIRDELGREVPCVMSPRRPGDPATLVADPKRAAELLGFHCRYSDISTIVRTAAQRFEEQSRHALIA
jgi:UDP-glucose 4-epimerase